MPTINKNGRKRPWSPEPAPFSMASKAGGFYHSSVWRNMRLYILAREPLCRMCKDEDRIKSAEMVDHIIPMNDG